MSAGQCPEPDQLEKLLLGKLDDDQSKALSEHLLHCPRCVALADSMESADQLVDALASKTGENLDHDVDRDQMRKAINRSQQLGESESDRVDWTAQPADSTVRPRPVVSTGDTPLLVRDRDPTDISTPAENSSNAVNQQRHPDIPGFEIIDTLGSGGMGVVYRARQIGLNRIVALKMIRAHALFDQESLNRFQVEAQSIALLTHPNIISIYEVGEANRLPFVALEYVSGGSLAEWINHTTLTSKASARLVKKLALAVQYAHDQGVIHRDLKPANVLLSPTEAANIVDASTPGDEPARPTLPGDRTADQVRHEPKITDFGLARLSAMDDRQTRSGSILGTPAYMSPEQAQGKHQSVGPRSDVYSLGAILYQLLTGRAPFRADSPVDTLRQVIDDEPVAPAILNRDVPKDLETICLKCLQKQPEARYQSAGELAADVDRFLKGEPVVARPLMAHVRLARWCRQRPAVASLMAATLSLLLTVAVGSSMFALRVSRLNQQTTKAKQDSENDRAVAVDAITKLSNALYSDMSRRGGTFKERQELIEVALTGLEQVTSNETRLADSGAIFAHLATAELHGLKGDLDLAGDSIDKAFELATELVQMFPDDMPHAYALARVYEAKSALAMATSGVDASLTAIDRATEILDPLIKKSPDSPQLLRTMLRVRRQMVSFYINKQDSESIYRECTKYLPMAEHLNELLPDGSGREVLAEVQRLLHYAALQMGKNSVAKQHGETAITRFAELRKEAPEDTVAAYSYWQAIQNRAMEHASEGRHEQASGDMDAAIRGYRELVDADPEELAAKYALADGLRWQCYQGCAAYDFDRVKQAGNESIAVLREMIKRSPANHSYKACFVASSGHVAEMARYEGDWQVLDRCLQEAVTIYRSLDPDNINMQFEGSYGTVFENVWEATRRHLETYDDDPTPDGTCALLCTYAFIESTQGRNSLSKATQADIARTCGLEISDQDSLFAAAKKIKRRSEFWLGSTLIHEAVVFGYLAEKAGDQAVRADHLARSVAAIKRVKRRHPQVAAMRLPVKMELQWVRQTELYQQEFGDP